MISGGHQLLDDVDWFTVTVREGQSVRAEILEGVSDTCQSGGIDSFLTLFAPDGTTLLASDDGGRGRCSLLDGRSALHTAAGNLPAGTYHLQVKRWPGASGPEGIFDYRLAVNVARPQRPVA